VRKMISNNESKLFYLAIGRNIKKYRDLRNYSLQILAEKVGLTKKTIQRYENGEIKIDMDRLSEITQALNVDMSQMLEGAHAFLGIEISDIETVRVPIVKKMSCNNNITAYEEIEKYEPTPKTWLSDAECFYLTAQGDSMVNARIQDGDLVLVRKQFEVKDGEIGAVIIDNTIYLKRIYKSNGTLILQSENPKYAPIVVNLKNENNVHVIGKLIKIIINV